MTPHNRVLTLIGGAALIASLTIGALFVQTIAADTVLRADEAAALRVEVLGGELLDAVQDQRETLAVYLLTKNPEALAQYNAAVEDEAATAAQVGPDVSTLSGISLANLNAILARVDAENDNWRATVAEPAIESIANGSPDEIWVAIRSVVQARIGTQPSTAQLVVEINSLQREMKIRSDALNGLRMTAIAVGVAIELLAACLSLWFVRRYGLRVARDTQRRVQASSERIEIVASLRSLRMQPTPEGTAAMIAEALYRLPGVDVAGVFVETDEGLLALAVVGMDGFPIATGDFVPDGHARYLRGRSEHGAWAEEWRRPTAPTVYDESLHAVGIKGRAFAPIQFEGEFVGLIGMATTDEAHGRHLVDDLPAVGEFAAVAESILAPALVARRAVGDQRRRVTTTIETSSFRPVYQPVVELASGLTVGFEALTRFEDGSRPDRVFAAAAECGLGIELETVTLAAALRDARHLAPEAWLSVNVSPAFLAEGSILVRMLADLTRPVVLEVTEHEVIESYAPLREAMRRLGPGVRLAVDDAGAGVANFNHLVELRPDFVKIDASLVHGVDADVSRRAMVVGLVHFAVEAGCEILAEGIETEAERATVAELGVTLGQGYLLAMPAAAESWLAARRSGSTVGRGVVRRAASHLVLLDPDGPDAGTAGRDVMLA